MQYSLLDMVQRILSAMDSDEVTSINDTVESYQVALLIEGVYNDIIAECNLPEVYTFLQLTAGGVTKPTLMTIPTGTLNLQWVKYDKQLDGDDFPNWVDLRYMCLSDFLDFTNTYRGNDVTNADTFDHTINSVTHTFIFRNDIAPTYYTTFDDNTILVDSYDADLDTLGVTAAKTRCWGAVGTDFTLGDSFTPPLNDNQFSLLMNEAKARAFVELKQASNINAEGHARRLRIRLRNDKNKVSEAKGLGLPNYGRR